MCLCTSTSLSKLPFITILDFTEHLGLQKIYFFLRLLVTARGSNGTHLYNNFPLVMNCFGIGISCVCYCVTASKASVTDSGLCCHLIMYPRCHDPSHS